MALEVQPTPRLRGDMALQFLKKIEEDSLRPVKLVETPKIDQLRERVRVQFREKQRSQ